MNLPVTDAAPSYQNSLFAFCEKKVAETVYKLHVMEIGNPAPNQPKLKVQTDMVFPPDDFNDFPVLVQACPKYGQIFVVSKNGFLFIYEA